MDMDLSHQYRLTLFFFLAFFPSLLTLPTTWPHHTKLFPFSLTIFIFFLCRNIAIPQLETHRNRARTCPISDFLAILPHVHSEIHLCKHPLAQALLVTGMFCLLNQHPYMFFPYQNPSAKAAFHQNIPIVIILIFLLQILCYSYSELPCNVEIYFRFFRKISAPIGGVEDDGWVSHVLDDLLFFGASR